MQIDLNALPDDPATLQRMLRAVLHQQGALAAENDKLRLLIQRLTRHQFGRRSEQLTPDQLQLGLEALEQALAANGAAQDVADDAVSPPRHPRPGRPARNHGALPAHLPRYEVLVDLEDQSCPCCGVALTPIGEVRTEQLDILPSQLRVRVTRRPRYACRGCDAAVAIAPAPDRPVAGGMPTEALVAQVLVAKYADALPLYRQAQMLARQGVVLDRSTLANWVARACWWLTPLYDLILGTALSSPKLFADDTTLPVLDPGPRPDQGGAAVVLRGGRPALGWFGPSGCSLCLRRGPQGRASGRAPGRVPGRVAGRRVCRVQAPGRGSRGRICAPRVLLSAHASGLL